MSKQVVDAEDGAAVVAHIGGMVRLELVEAVTEDSATVRLTRDQAKALALAVLPEDLRTFTAECWATRTTRVLP